MRTFEVKTYNHQIEDTSWLSKYIINITIRDLGIAFPITLEQDIQLPRYSAKDATINAFLFSIPSIIFCVNRGETGETTVRNLSFQFISL